MRPYAKLYYITAAAIRQDGSVYSVDPPGRHGDVMREMVERDGLPTPILGEQGFLDQDGQFVSRNKAAQIAVASGQVKAADMRQPELFTEDLW